MSVNKSRPEHAVTLNDPGAPDVSTPTFPSEAELLLDHLKLGAARPAAPAPAPPEGGPFPVIPNYQIESELGRGGMGIVYKAKHTGLQHAVAIKMILSAAHASAGERTRFLAEAEAIAAVKHPNVVQVFDMGEAGGRPFFVMEFVAGGNLAARLEGGPLPPPTAAHLIEQVARGVQAAHEESIVHRDLKPANILLANGRCEPTGESAAGAPAGSRRSFVETPKVSDFGLAKRLSSDLTRSQAVMGTPQYMAPEQAGGKAKFVGPGADVYALGTILYECLTGTVPFKSESEAWSVIRQVVEDAPVPPRALAPGVPRDLELICLKCLEKEPHHRYLTAAALADDLRRFLNGEPVSVRPIGTVTRAVRWTKRRPTAAALVLVAALLVLIVPSLVVWQQGRLDRRDADTTAAREREDAAQKLADAAKRAEEEANQARAAAERLAGARELFALQNKLRTRAAERPLGWTVATRTELPRAVALAGADPALTADLRSLAAGALLAPDLLPAEPVAKGMTGSALAVDPASGLIAVGEYKSRGACRVMLVDPATGRTVRTLSYPAALLVDAQDGTRALAFAPGGKTLFAGTRYGRVIRFDLDQTKNTPAREWKAWSTSVDQLAVGGDGATVYGLSRGDSPIRVWAADTGKPVAALAPDAGVFCTFDLTAAGDLVASTGGHVYRFGPDHKRLAGPVNTPGQRVARVTDTMLLLGDGATLRVGHVPTGLYTDQFSDPALRLAAHEGFLRTIAVRPGGGFAATAAGDTDRTVKVWELASGRLIGTVSVPGHVIDVAWSADGRFLLATAPGAVSRWELVCPQRYACASAVAIEAFAPTADGRAAAVTAHLNGYRGVLLGAPDRFRQLVPFQDPGGNSRAGVSADPNGVLAITQSGPGIFHWRPGTVPPHSGFAKHITWCPRFSPDGRTLWALVDAKEVQAFDPATGNRVGRWRNSLGEIVSGLASLDALAVGRTAAAVGGRDGTVYVCDLATCEPTSWFRVSGDPVLAVDLVPDGSLVVAGTQNGKLRTVRPADKTELPAVSAHAGGLTTLAVSADGALLATGGRDRAVRFWARTGDRFELLFEVGDLPGAARDLRFGPNNTLFVLLGHEHAVRVWDLGQLKARLAELKLGW